MLEMEVPTNLQKGTFVKELTLYWEHNLPSYWPVLAQPPIHIPPQSSAKIIVNLSLQNPHCDPISQFTEFLATLLGHSVPFHRWIQKRRTSKLCSHQQLANHPIMHPTIFFLDILSRTTNNPIHNATHYTKFPTMWCHMHQLAINHTSILLNQATSSSHCKYNQRDHIESTTHPQINIHSITLRHTSNKVANSMVKEAAKWQSAPLEPTPASDLIDSLRK